MAIFLAPMVLKGLLGTAVRTAGSRSLSPYISALTSQGIQRKTAQKIAKQFSSTIKDAQKKGQFPLADKKLASDISKNLTNAERKLLTQRGLASAEAPAVSLSKQRMLGRQALPTGLARQNPTGQMSGMPIYGTRTGGEITRIPLPQARITNQFPVPAGGVSPLEQIAARNALVNQRAGAAMINKPIVQTVDPGRGLSKKEFVTGAGLLSLPMFFDGSETPATPIPKTNAVSLNNDNGQTQINADSNINNNQNNQQNIFGKKLAQTFFPEIPQSNKELINLAILAGSLEFLKPRQPGENLASQASRALQAGTRVGADVQKRQLEALTTQAALQKAKLGKQVSVTKEKKEAFEKVIDTVYDTDPSFKTTIDLIKQKVGTDIGSDLGDDQRRAIELEAMSINASTGLGVVESTKIAAQNFLTGQKSIPTTSGEDIDADVTEQ